MGLLRGTARGTRFGAWLPRIAAVALLVALAAGIVAFGLGGAALTEAGPDPVWPPDAWPSRAALEAHSAGGGNATVDGVNCARGLLFEDEQNLPSGGEGALEFLLEEPCRMDAVLTLRFAAGDVEVRLEGPAGVVFAEDGTSIALMGGGVGTNPEEEHPGPHPPGTYRYSFTADGRVDFRFRVEGSP